MYQTTSLNFYKPFSIGTIHCEDNEVTFFISSDNQDSEVVFEMNAVIDYIDTFLYEEADNHQRKIYRNMGEEEVINALDNDMGDDFFCDLIRKHCEMEAEHPSEVIAWGSWKAAADFIDGWKKEIEDKQRVPQGWIAGVLTGAGVFNIPGLSFSENIWLTEFTKTYHRWKAKEVELEIDHLERMIQITATEGRA